MVDQQRIATEETLYMDLLDAYRQIGCTVWESPDEEEIPSLDDLVKRDSVTTIHPHRTYFAINPSHIKSSIFDAMGKLLFPYNGGVIGLYGFIPRQREIIVEEPGTNVFHRIPIDHFISFVKSISHLNGSASNGNGNLK